MKKFSRSNIYPHEYRRDIYSTYELMKRYPLLTKFCNFLFKEDTSPLNEDSDTRGGSAMHPVREYVLSFSTVQREEDMA